MLDSHHYRLGKLLSPICLCFAGLEGKSNEVMEEIKLRGSFCATVKRFAIAKEKACCSEE